MTDQPVTFEVLYPGGMIAKVTVNFAFGEPLHLTPDNTPAQVHRAVAESLAESLTPELKRRLP
jgi:hypothetical protein